MEARCGRAGEHSPHKRPHSPCDVVEVICCKKEKKDSEESAVLGTAAVEDDLIIVDGQQEEVVTSDPVTSADTVKPSGKEDFVVTYWRPADTIKYPHAREDCKIHKFNTATWGVLTTIYVENATFCDSCYCYVCDIPAKECQDWKGSHCMAHSKNTSWKLKRQKAKASNSRKRARSNLTAHPSLRSCLEQEIQTEGFISSLDGLLDRIDSEYSTYSEVDDESDYYDDDCWCRCHSWGYWDYSDEPYCYRCEENHYSSSSHDYYAVQRALNSAVASARTHWQNKRPAEALIILDETLRSLCQHQPREETNTYWGSSDGGLANSKKEVLQAMEELLVDMFVDRSGVLLSSMKEKAVKTLKGTMNMVPQDPESANISLNIALGLKSWDDPELMSVLDGSYKAGDSSTAGQRRATCSFGLTNTADVIVVETTTAGNSGDSQFAEDHVVVKKRLQVLEEEKKWQEAANYIRTVTIKCTNIYFNGIAKLKTKLFTYLAHLGKWTELCSELQKSSTSSDLQRPRLDRIEVTDFLNIMKCFTPKQDRGVLPASSTSASTPCADVDLDEVFRVALYALGQNGNLRTDKCVSWFIEWTCQDKLQELPKGRLQKLTKLANEMIKTSKNSLPGKVPKLNSKVGRAVTATCWLVSNSYSLSWRQYGNFECTSVMDGYKNNLWLAVFLLTSLCDNPSGYNPSDAPYHVANWITKHGASVLLQLNNAGLEKVLSVLSSARAKGVLGDILATVLTGDKTSEEKANILQKVKKVVSKMTKNRELVGKVLLYMAKMGSGKEVCEELRKKIRGTESQCNTWMNEDDFLDTMKALVENTGKASQAAESPDPDEIFNVCIQALVWNSKVQQSLSFVTWFLGWVCAEKMEEPSQEQLKIFQENAKSVKQKPHMELVDGTVGMERKVAKAVGACVCVQPAFQSSRFVYSTCTNVKNVLDIFKPNKWLLAFMLNQPGGVKDGGVAEWISKNGLEILDKLTDAAVTNMMSSTTSTAAFTILKGLVGSGKKSLTEKQRILKFAKGVLTQLNKPDGKFKKEIYAYIQKKIIPIVKTVNDSSAKSFLQKMYQKNFEFEPTMKSLEELKKVCSPEEWSEKRDSCLVHYINGISSTSTCLTCLDLLMRNGSDHVTKLLSLRVARDNCQRNWGDGFNPASPAVIKKITTVLKELPRAEATNFLVKARDWLVKESWCSLLCNGRSCKHKVQPAMDNLWKATAKTAPGELVTILQSAMEAMERKLNTMSVTHWLRKAYVDWLLRVKDAFQIANQLFQFGQILNKSMRLLKRKTAIGKEVRSSGLLHNIPDKENPPKQIPAPQHNAKKSSKRSGSTPSKPLKTLNINNGAVRNADNTDTLLMKELIPSKPVPVVESCPVKRTISCAPAYVKLVKMAKNATAGNNIDKGVSSASVQPAEKSTGKGCPTSKAGTGIAKDGQDSIPRGTANLPISSKDRSPSSNDKPVESSVSPSTSAQASLTSQPVPTNDKQTSSSVQTTQATVGQESVPVNTGAQKGVPPAAAPPELVHIVSKISELTSIAGVDGAFQLLIRRMTGKMAVPSLQTEEIVSKLLTLKGPITLKIGNNKLVLNAKLTSSANPTVPQASQASEKVANTPSLPTMEKDAMPAMTVSGQFSSTGLPTTPATSRAIQPAPVHSNALPPPVFPIVPSVPPQVALTRPPSTCVGPPVAFHGLTGPNLAPRPMLLLPSATSSLSASAVPSALQTGGNAMPVAPTGSTLPSPLSTQVMTASTSSATPSASSLIQSIVLQTGSSAKPGSSTYCSSPVIHPIDTSGR